MRITSALPLATSFGSLKKIRQQLTEKNLSNGIILKPLTEESLHIAWPAYIEKLESRKNHSAVTNFKMATLNIIDNNCIEIIVETAFHQKFIEAERTHLIDHFQQFFNNKLLTYKVKIIKKEEIPSSEEKPLSSMKQYLKLSEQYPCIKELKERLNLHLDFLNIIVYRKG